MNNDAYTWVLSTQAKVGDLLLYHSANYLILKTEQKGNGINPVDFSPEVSEIVHFGNWKTDGLVHLTVLHLTTNERKLLIFSPTQEVGICKG